MKHTLRSDAEKRRLLVEFRASGLTCARFAKQRGLSPNSLRQWAARPDLQPAPSKARFVDVDLVDEAVSPLLVIQIAGSGHRVEVRRGFDSGELRRLLAALC